MNSEKLDKRAIDGDEMASTSEPVSKKEYSKKKSFIWLILLLGVAIVVLVVIITRPEKTTQESTQTATQLTPTNLAEKVAGLKILVNNATTTAATADSLARTAQEAVDELTKTASDADSTLASHVSNLEGKINDIPAQIAAVGDKRYINIGGKTHKALEKGLENLSNSLVGANGKVKGVEEGLNALNGRMGATEGRLNAHDQRISSLEEKLAKGVQPDVEAAWKALELAKLKKKPKEKDTNRLLTIREAYRASADSTASTPPDSTSQ